MWIMIPTDFHIFQRGWNHQPDFFVAHATQTGGCKSSYAGRLSESDRANSFCCFDDQNFSRGNWVPQMAIAFVSRSYLSLVISFDIHRLFETNHCDFFPTHSWRFAREVSFLLCGNSMTGMASEFLSGETCPAVLRRLILGWFRTVLVIAIIL